MRMLSIHYESLTLHQFQEEASPAAAEAEAPAAEEESAPAEAAEATEAEA